jgi:hypothetical protein
VFVAPKVTSCISVVVPLTVAEPLDHKLEEAASTINLGWHIADQFE